MPTFTVELETDVGAAPVLEESDDGWRGSRSFRVNTQEEDLAMDAPGIPVMGEAWSSSRADLIVTRRSSEYLHGTDDGATQIGGMTRVRVEYGELSSRGRLVVPSAGLAYTEFNPTVGTVTLYQPLDTETLSFTEPIAGGQGASVKKTSHTAVVHIWRAIDDSLSLAALLQLENKTNTNEVRLPPILGRTDLLVFAPGQCLYNAFYINVLGRLMEIVHEIDLAPDFLIRYQPENSTGRGIGARRAVPGYESIAFPSFV